MEGFTTFRPGSRFASGPGQGPGPDSDLFAEASVSKDRVSNMREWAVLESCIGLEERAVNSM